VGASDKLAVVVGDLVIVGVSGRLVRLRPRHRRSALDGPVRGASYSSPRPLIIDGVAQVLLLSAAGATSVRLADGALLWEHPWKGYPIVQPNLTGRRRPDQCQRQQWHSPTRARAYTRRWPRRMERRRTLDLRTG